MLLSTPSLLASSSAASSISACKVALLGLPDDNGIELNSGRLGASQGPNAFRAALARYGVADPAGFVWPRVFDAGDIIPAEGRGVAPLHETHRRVTETTRQLLDLGLFPIAIGGGHDLTFPFVRAVIEHQSAHANPLHHGVYFDAHLDVRETTGSGMPFRRLIEDCGINSLAIAGMDPFANARPHVEWFLSHGGQITEAESVSTDDLSAPTFVSFDLDVLDASVAPGVSAMNPAGMSMPDALYNIEQLARSPHVKCFDIMELSPPNDPSGRTPRVAVSLFLQFLFGFAHRP